MDFEVAHYVEVVVMLVVFTRECHGRSPFVVETSIARLASKVKSNFSVSKGVPMRVRNQPSF